MLYKQANLWRLFQRAKQSKAKPLVHALVNSVSAPSVAQLLSALGASPIMGDALEEVEDLARQADVLLLNLGTPSVERYEAVRRVLLATQAQGTPVVLDPVGLGVSRFRQESFALLLPLLKGRSCLIRGNQAELRCLTALYFGEQKALEEGRSWTRGVDSLPTEMVETSTTQGTEDDCRAETKEADLRLSLQRLSRSEDWTLVQTGEVDLLAEQGHVYRVQHGDERLARQSGIGCLQGALMAYYWAKLKPHRLEAAFLGVLSVTLSAERLATELATQKTEWSWPAYREAWLGGLTQLSEAELQTLRLEELAGDAELALPQSFSGPGTPSLSRGLPVYGIGASLQSGTEEEKRLYLVKVEASLQAGLRCFQFREKTLTGEACLALARAVVELCHRYQAICLINDSIELALASGADGVHLGLSDGDWTEAREKLGTDKILGLTAHSLAEAKQALLADADYLGCGDVFGTTTKRGTTTLSLEELKQICEAVPIPVVAIGGVTVERLPALEGLGLAGVCTVSELYGGDLEEVKGRYEALEQAVKQHGLTWLQ